LKRIISLTLVFVMAIMAWMPVQGTAQEDKDLEQAIKAVKAKIQIPESFTEFNYNAGSEGEKIIWYLDWASKDKMEGSINVRIDGDGTILGYYCYKPYDYDSTRKFPKIGRHEAMDTAEAFIERMAPGLVSNLRLVDDSEILEMERTHRFNYIRLENGIPYHGNSVNVEVNSETGEVQSYNYNWSEGLSFPKPEDVIPAEDAMEAYKEQMGLKLIYEYNYDGEESRLYAVYMPVYDTNYGIDAFTGDRIKVNLYYHGSYLGMGTERAAMEKAEADMAQLTPEERKAVDEISALLTRERAESIARGVKELEISRDYKVTGAYLQKDWDVSQGYTWELNFTDESADKKPSSNIWVRINAKNGDIKGYSRYIPMEGEREGKYTQAQARLAVEKFMNAVHREKSKDMEFDPVYEGHYYPLGRDENAASYNFRYIRKVNGVQFPDNSMYISFDAVNGKVSSFSMNWYDLEFPPLNDVLDMEDVYDTMFGEVGLELVYSNSYPEEYRDIYQAEPKPEIKLVYGMKQGKPLIFDAWSGEILDYSGKPYREKRAAAYTDITGHYAESQITALAEYGIALPGTEFKPDDNIIQKDFLGLLVRTMGYSRSFEDDRELEEMYNLLIREKVVKKEEKDLDAAVAREEAIKYIIRAQKYQDVADIKGIFVTGFSDQSSIAPELVGYVAIAKGLNIVGGSSGYFYPKNSLKRAEAAVMLYNCLTR